MRGISTRNEINDRYPLMLTDVPATGKKYFPTPHQKLSTNISLGMSGTSSVFCESCPR